MAGDDIRREMQEYLKRHPHLRSRHPKLMEHIRDIGRLLQDAEERAGRAEELAMSERERKKEAEFLAARDSLTGLYRREHLDEIMERIVGSAKRNAHDYRTYCYEVGRDLRIAEPDPREPLHRQLLDSRVALIMLDVDKFKNLNDRYGHLVGDNALAELGRAVRNSLKRVTDVPARYGGEELAILLLQTGYDGAIKVALRIRDSIRGVDVRDYKGRVIHDNGENPLRITVSMGIARLRADENPSEEYKPELLISMADEALYASKDSGRNAIYCNKRGQIERIAC